MERSPGLGHVAVTGANGHLGRRLLARLCSGSRAPAGPDSPGGARVRALVRSQGSADVLRAHPEAAHFELRIVDWNDTEGVARALEGCASVVNLVGILKESRRTRYHDAHEGVAESLAEAAARAGARRIVHLSILGSHPDAENACLASKGRAEEILLAGKVPTTVLQVPMVLGPGDVAARALRGQALAPVLFLVRGGVTMEQPIDAEDVVSAIVAACRDAGSDDQRLALAGPESLPHRELVARAAALHGRSPRVLPVPYGLARVLAGLLERVSAEPPFTPAMLGVLEHDDRIDPAPAVHRLGISLTPLDETLRRTVGPQAETA